MIRSCAHCGRLADIDGVEDVLRWLCADCHTAGWRADIVGNVYRIRPKGGT